MGVTWLALLACSLLPPSAAIAVAAIWKMDQQVDGFSPSLFLLSVTLSHKQQTNYPHLKLSQPSRGNSPHCSCSLFIRALGFLRSLCGSLEKRKVHTVVGCRTKDGDDEVWIRARSSNYPTDKETWLFFVTCSILTS